DVLDPALELRCPREHIRLRRLEYAVEPAKDDERQDHPPVLRLLVDAAQLVGDRPDEAGVVLDLLIAAHSGVHHTRSVFGSSGHLGIAQSIKGRRGLAGLRGGKPWAWQVLITPRFSTCWSG